MSKSFRVYPFPEGEAVSGDFEMRINGEYVPLHAARVSAYPINRRWPGHQRPLNQTERASFASFCMTEPVQITLKPNRAFKDVVIRPLSKKVDFTVKDGVIAFTLPSAGFYTVELDGYHKALHIFADSEADYKVDKTSPDVLYYGPGEHNAGVITLHSNQTLFIDEGAVVYGRIVAREANNVRVLGRGILDNSRCVETILHEFNDTDREQIKKGVAVQNATRTDASIFVFCDNLVMEGITFRDSLCYTVHPVCCRNLSISNVKIIGNWRYNSDGIDMHNCEHVHVSNCFIRTFDDSICVKGFDYILPMSEMHHNGVSYEDFKDVLIEKCVIWNDWGIALEIGAETRANEICDITFRDCDLIHTNGLCCDIQNVDYAVVHDVLFEDIRCEISILQKTVLQETEDQQWADDPHSTLAPWAVAVRAQHHFEYSDPNDPRRGINRDITFRNIAAVGTYMPGSYFLGVGEDHLSGPVRIENLTFNGKKITSLKEIEPTENRFVKDITVC